MKEEVDKIVDSILAGIEIKVDPNMPAGWWRIGPDASSNFVIHMADGREYQGPFPPPGFLTPNP